MARWRCRAQKRSDSGVSAIEYGLLLAAIAAAIFLTVMFGFRQTVVDALTGFTDSFSQLVNGGAGGGGGGGGGGGVGGGGGGGNPSPSPTVSPTP